MTTIAGPLGSGKTSITESELLAAYQRVQAKARTGAFNFMHLQDLVQEIESEQFENGAGLLNNFLPWHNMKAILGLVIEETTASRQQETGGDS